MFSQMDPSGEKGEVNLEIHHHEIDFKPLIWVVWKIVTVKCGYQFYFPV